MKIQKKPKVTNKMQQANIGPQDVPRASPSNVTRMFLKIIFDHAWNILIWYPGDVLKLHPRDVPGTFIRDVPKKLSGRSQDVPYPTLKTRTRDDMGSSVGCSLNFFLLCFRELFDWPNLSKSNVIFKVYLEPSRTSKLKLFSQI